MRNKLILNVFIITQCTANGMTSRLPFKIWPSELAYLKN